MIKHDNGNDDGENRRSEAGDGRTRFPDRYGLDYVAAIARGPTSLFVYWELSGQRSEHYRKSRTGEPDWCLSLVSLDERGGVRRSTSVSVDPDSGNHYLKVQPGGRYRAELGVRIGGAFHPVCQSRECPVPKDAPAVSPLHRPKTASSTGGVHHAGSGHTGAASGRKTPAGLVWEEGMIENSASSPSF